VASTVAAELAEAAEKAMRAGVPRSDIWFDPGFGFAKTAEQNFELARNIEKLRGLGKLFVGVSRKSFIGAASGVTEAAKRLPGTLAMELYLADVADVLRTHDVAALRQALAVRKMLNRTV
jgi:dihydropteroate synthase